MLIEPLFNEPENEHEQEGLSNLHHEAYHHIINAAEQHMAGDHIGSVMSAHAAADKISQMAKTVARVYPNTNAAVVAHEFASQAKLGAAQHEKHLLGGFNEG
jgi:hypothetical protein